MEEDKQQEGGNLNDNTIKLKEEVKTSKIENFSFLKRNLLKYRNSEVFLSYGLLIALLVFTYIIRSNFFLIPFERDEGIYAYFGKLILEGKIPYKDFYEFKYPGLFYAYALMIKIFGYKLYNLHLGFTILNLLNIVIVFFISRKFFRPVISLCSAIIFCILSLNPNISGFTIQSEHLVIFFISIGLIFVPSIKNINQNKYFLLVG
ncbi:MAG: ArnT family glycosyltransferase, partial [Bacteroidota bacterium]